MSTLIDLYTQLIRERLETTGKIMRELTLQFMQQQDKD